MPTSLRPKVKAAVHTIMNAKNKEAVDLALDRFQQTYAAKYPKAADRLLKDREVLLAHFDFTDEHWIHLSTNNAIESTFATVRLRTNKPKGAGSRSAGLAMAYKLLDAAQARWRCVKHPTWSRSFALGRPSWMTSRLSAKTRSTPRESPANPQH